MAFTEGNFTSHSKEQNSSDHNNSASNQQVEPQTHEKDGSSFANFTASPSSRLTAVSLGLQDAQWDELLKDICSDANSQDPNDHTKPSPVCMCFDLALIVIKQLSKFRNSPKVEDTGRLLEVSNSAIEACEQFSSCSPSCHENHVLLYATILQQLERHYLSLAKRMNETSWEGHTSMVKVVLGTFEVKTSLDSVIGKAFLAAEKMRVSTCALKLIRAFETYVNDGSTEEVKCQLELLSALGSDLGRG